MRKLKNELVSNQMAYSSDALALKAELQKTEGTGTTALSPILALILSVATFGSVGVITNVFSAADAQSSKNVRQIVNLGKGGAKDRTGIRAKLSNVSVGGMDLRHRHLGENKRDTAFVAEIFPQRLARHTKRT